MANCKFISLSLLCFYNILIKFRYLDFRINHLKFIQYRCDTILQLKRNIELRLNEYPELFPKVLPANAVSYVNEKMLFGVLKSSDNNGRRVLIFNASEYLS